MIKDLAKPAQTMYILEKYGIHARKRYGQNFLVDESVVHRIIDGSGTGSTDTVLEIGPGIGTMTGYLAQQAGRVVSVEVDENLCPVLEETLEGLDNVEIIFSDVLKVDLRELFRERFPQTDPAGHLRVVANLPYYVTTPVILYLLEQQDLFSSITLMVQKEVAERIIAGPGSKAYGALSLAVQYYAAPKIIGSVPPRSFIPRPNGESAILHMDAYAHPPVDVPADRLFSVIRASFNQRRKTLVNGLMAGMASCGAKRNPAREEVETALAAMGLPPAVRGETLDLAQFAALTGLLEACF